MRDAGQGDLNPPQVYQWLTANFTNACGDTANLLRETTFPDSGAERSLDDLTEVVAELRRPGVANIRINSRGHAFFVERRGDDCRIPQSYFGRYALADSAGEGAHAGATTMPAAQLAYRVQSIGDHHLANRREGRRRERHPRRRRQPAGRGRYQSPAGERTARPSQRPTGRVRGHLGRDPHLHPVPGRMDGITVRLTPSDSTGRRIGQVPFPWR